MRAHISRPEFQLIPPYSFVCLHGNSSGIRAAAAKQSADESRRIDEFRRLVRYFAKFTAKPFSRGERYLGHIEFKRDMLSSISNE